jgi:hypothetical protein
MLSEARAMGEDGFGMTAVADVVSGVVASRRGSAGVLGDDDNGAGIPIPIAEGLILRW